MDRKHDGQHRAIPAAGDSSRDKTPGANPPAGRPRHPVAWLSSETLAAMDLEFHEHFRDAPYYSSGRDWEDYAPAYRYGYATRGTDRLGVFAAREAQLAQGWDNAKGASRLCWAEALGAVRDAWRRIDSAGPASGRHLGPEH